MLGVECLAEAKRSEDWWMFASRFSLQHLAFAHCAGTAQNSPMLATWRSFTWSSGFVTGKALLRGLSRGETLRGQPREAENFTRLLGQPREAKPFTRMAKWEIRFQRFAISFRPSNKALVCGLSREATCPSKPRRSWKPFTRDNEKFHLSPAYRCDSHQTGQLPPDP
jgi:hypothetical protein